MNRSLTRAIIDLVSIYWKINSLQYTLTNTLLKGKNEQYNKYIPVPGMLSRRFCKLKHHSHSHSSMGYQRTKLRGFGCFTIYGV